MNKPDEYEILERAHEAAGAHMMQKSPRADELISCLEGEIAKRDEELAACRVAVENCEVFRARIAELEARIVWLECEAQVNAAPVSEANAQGVVMPERANASHGSHDHQSGWNACLDEIARLNAAQQRLEPSHD